MDYDLLLRMRFASREGYLVEWRMKAVIRGIGSDVEQLECLAANLLPRRQ